MVRTSIQVSEALRLDLESRKRHPRQSFEEVIRDALAATPADRPLRPVLPERVRSAIDSLLGALRRLYGDRLLRVILYGSYARGEAREDSDVDVLIVLAGTVETTREISRIVEITYGLLLDRGIHISVMPISEADFLTRASPLLMNVRRDGVLL